MSNTNEKTIRSFIEKVINQKDFSILNEIVHPEYVHLSPGEKLDGPEELRNYLEQFHNAFPDMHVNIDDLIVADYKTVISIT